jgi:thymidylate synthase ThyX
LAWLHLIRERSHPTAQTETREWVQQFIVPEVAKRFPVTWEAIETHTGVSIPNVQANEEDQVS